MSSASMSLVAFPVTTPFSSTVKTKGRPDSTIVTFFILPASPRSASRTLNVGLKRISRVFSTMSQLYFSNSNWGACLFMLITLKCTTVFATFFSPFPHTAFTCRTYDFTFSEFRDLSSQMWPFSSILKGVSGSVIVYVTGCLRQPAALMCITVLLTAWYSVRARAYSFCTKSNPVEVTYSMWDQGSLKPHQHQSLALAKSVTFLSPIILMLNQSKRSEWLSFVVIVFNPQVVKMATFEINSTCMCSLNAIKQKADLFS